MYYSLGNLIGTVAQSVCTGSLGCLIGMVMDLFGSLDHQVESQGSEQCNFCEALRETLYTFGSLAQVLFFMSPQATQEPKGAQVGSNLVEGKPVCLVLGGCPQWLRRSSWLPLHKLMSPSSAHSPLFGGTVALLKLTTEQKPGSLILISTGGPRSTQKSDALKPKTSPNLQLCSSRLRAWSS